MSAPAPVFGTAGVATAATPEPFDDVAPADVAAVVELPAEVELAELDWLVE
jgi:hypothetical protein